MLEQLRNRLNMGMDNARETILNKVRPVKNFIREYKDIPAYAAQTALEKAAPDIKARREDTDTRNDELIGKLRDAYTRGKISSERGFLENGKLEGLYNSQVPKPLQNRRYAERRSDAVDRLATMNQISDTQVPASNVNFNPSLREIIALRHKGAAGQEHPEDQKIDMDLRAPAPRGFEREVMAHEFGHAQMDNMRPDKLERLPEDPVEFLRMYDYYAEQPTRLGEQLRYLHDRITGAPEGLYDQRDPGDIANELYAQIHTIDPQVLQKEAPDLYGVSGWR